MHMADQHNNFNSRLPAVMRSSFGEIAIAKGITGSILSFEQPIIKETPTIPRSNTYDTKNQFGANSKSEDEEEISADENENENENENDISGSFGHCADDGKRKNKAKYANQLNKNTKTDERDQNKSFVTYEKKKYEDTNKSFIQINHVKKNEKNKYQEDIDNDMNRSAILFKPIEAVTKQDFENKRNIFEIGTRKKGKSIRKKKQSPPIQKVPKADNMTENIIFVPPLNIASITGIAKDANFSKRLSNEEQEMLSDFLQNLGSARDTNRISRISGICVKQETIIENETSEGRGKVFSFKGKGAKEKGHIAFATTANQYEVISETSGDCSIMERYINNPGISNVRAANIFIEGKAKTQTGNPAIVEKHPTFTLDDNSNFDIDYSKLLMNSIPAIIKDKPKNKKLNLELFLEKRKSESEKKVRMSASSKLEAKNQVDKIFTSENIPQNPKICGYEINETSKSIKSGPYKQFESVPTEDKLRKVKETPMCANNLVTNLQKYTIIGGKKTSDSKEGDEAESYYSKFKKMSVNKNDNRPKKIHKEKSTGKKPNLKTEIHYRAKSTQAKTKINKPHKVNIKPTTNFSKVNVTFPIDATPQDEYNDITLKRKAVGDNSHQYVVLQKQLKYRAYNLDLHRKSRVVDPKEVLYNNVADFQTINQLNQATKKAYDFQFCQLKKTLMNLEEMSPKERKQSRESSDDNDEGEESKHSKGIIRSGKKKIEKGCEKKAKCGKGKKVDPSSESKKRKIKNGREGVITEEEEEGIVHNGGPSVKKENEITVLRAEIDNLKKRLTEHEEMERIYLKQIAVLKDRLNSVEIINNNNNNLEVLHTEEIKTKQQSSQSLISSRSAENRMNCENENEDFNLLLSEKSHRRVSKLKIQLSALDDLGCLEFEEKFSKVYDIPKLRSFLFLLKEIGLEPHVFYDDANPNEYDNDICEDCYTNSSNNQVKSNNNQSHKCPDGKWNFMSVLDLHPKLKSFIGFLAKRILYDNKTRLKLEEKTLKILSNDLKAIDQLDQKVKKLEKKNSQRNNKISEL